MKATNIFQSLKSSGKYNTDGLKPGLPGLSSPIDKKLVGNQKNLPQELKDKIEAAPETSPTNYGTKAGSLKNNPEEGKLISKETNEKTGITTSKYDVGTNMPKIVRTKKTVKPPKPESPHKKKGCGYKN